MSATIDTTFLDDLRELRRVSRLILVALEADDLDRVQKLASTAATLTASISVRIKENPEERDRHAETLLALTKMNDRIVEALAERREEAQLAASDARSQRFKVVKHRQSSSTEAAFINHRR